MLESEGEIERVRTVSDVVSMDGRVPAITPVVPAPNIANLNVSKSSKVHIGSKFVSVTQNVHNPDLVKGSRKPLIFSSVCPNKLRIGIIIFIGWALLVATGLTVYFLCFNLSVANSERLDIGRCLCFDLVAPIGPRALRCSVAIFVLCALMFAILLCIYIAYIVLPGRKTRQDIDLPLRQYLWDVVKNSSTTERLCCAVAVIVVIVCVSLIVYFTTTSSKAAAAAYDKAPHEWKIKREMWLAQPYLDNSLISPQFAPVMLVVIQHTVGPECNRFVLCAAELRNLQQWFLKSLEYDIPYNFLIGNDGRVYEGRGWNVEGAHTLGYNRCSVGIGFTGDYREEIPSHASVTEAQMNRTRMILAEGVKLGYLRPDYLIVGALDLGDTASPGSNLYNAIRKWPNYDHKNRFNGLTCEQMQNIYGNQTLWDFKATGKAEH